MCWFPDLVGDLLCCYGQPVLLFRLDALVVLVEVEDEGGEIRRFPSDVGDGSSNNLVDEQSPVHRPDPGKSPKQGIGHGEGDPLRLFRI